MKRLICLGILLVGFWFCMEARVIAIADPNDPSSDLAEDMSDSPTDAGGSTEAKDSPTEKDDPSDKTVVSGGGGTNSTKEAADIEERRRIRRIQRQAVINKGMSSSPPGVPPFGTASNGLPLWPIDDPGVPPAAPTSPTRLQVSAIVGSVISPAGRPSSAQETVLNMNIVAPQANTEVTQIKGILADQLTVPETQTGETGQILRQDSMLSPGMIESFQDKFALDSQRHAKFVFEGMFGKALLISTKWLNLARMYPLQINQMTCNCHIQKGFPDFQSYISKVVDDDRKAVENAAP